MLKFIPQTSDFMDFFKNSFRGPRILRTFVKIHSTTSDFADFCKNSFCGPRILQTSIKFIPRTSDFVDFFSGPWGPRGPRNSPGRFYSQMVHKFYSERETQTAHAHSIHIEISFFSRIESMRFEQTGLNYSGMIAFYH